MACICLKSKGALFTLWGKPEAEDMPRVVAEVDQVARETSGPIVYVTRVPADAPPPEGDIRKEINRLLPRMLERCSSYHVILEGDGFIAAVKRGVLTSLMQPLRRQRSVYVHATAAQIHRVLKPAEREFGSRLLRAAETAGYLSCAAPPVAR